MPNTATQKNLLTCVALSPNAPVVVNEGLRIAAALDLRPIFVHVGQDAAAAREAVARVVQQAGGPRLEEDSIVFRTGPPGRVIGDAASALGSEMIVMGALDRDPPLTRIWGSVARQVARAAPCSVLLLPGPSAARHPPTGTVVASVKLDEESARMVPMVLRLAARPGTSLHFVHEFPVSEARWAVTGDSASAEGIRSVEEFIYRRKRAEERLLDEFLSGFELHGYTLTRASLAALEGDEAVKYAQLREADLLVMPTPYRRLNFWDRFFHHPTELALRRLPCGLLLYRQPDPYQR